MLQRLGTAPTIATWIVLISLLVLANLIGNASPYIYLIVLVIAWPFLFMDADARHAMNRWESYAYLCAFLFMLVAFIFAAGGWEHFENVGNFLPYLLFIPTIGLLDRSARPNNTLIVATLALVGAIIALGTAVYDVHILGIRRVVGLFNTTNPFAMASVMLGFLSLMGFWAIKGWRRFIFFVGPLVATYAVILAGTRAAILIIMALCVLFAIFVGVKLSNRGRLILAGAAVLAGSVGVAGVIALGADTRAFQAIESIYLFLTEGQAIDRSVAIRLELYRGGILAFFDAPIFGHGWRHHVQAARPYMMDPSIAEHVARWSHLHNDYINFAALAGIFGLASYFIYLLVPIVATWRSERDSQHHARLYGGFVVSACYAIYGIFGSAFAAELLLCFGAVFTAVLLGFCKDRPRA
ncbi:O-antigen ligase family protein [Pelagibacterium sp. H642]|uniref:O-antigen ligase family protein n=1 Tax=Pelagibacterium sp. H642 TaxID=1881069 RepID=UPI00281631BE|nr:O-antigen ligase family protein [Pelagibacterium sp. H642]WMT89074.1 O-antigen ligase family protein [Pelagibacterium sp. H642]